MTARDSRKHSWHRIGCEHKLKTKAVLGMEKSGVISFAMDWYQDKIKSKKGKRQLGKNI